VLCKSFGLKATAKDLGVRADPFVVARAYSKSFVLAYRQAPFEGCLDGLLASEN
jgi:hypothetical protein